MSSSDHVPVTNRLFDLLPRKSHKAMLAQCTEVHLKYGDTLCRAGGKLENVYFPTRGIISLIATVNRSATLEVGLVGNEGMFGVPIALGIKVSSVQAIVQGSGDAWQMKASHLQQMLVIHPALRRELHRYTSILLMQLAQTAVCTCFHVLDARLARWMLMMQDRAHADSFYLTHSLLSEMLGVRRSGITTAAGLMQRAGLIHYSRGDITVLDREGLEQIACDCYQQSEEAYSQLFGKSRRPPHSPEN